MTNDKGNVADQVRRLTFDDFGLSEKEITGLGTTVKALLHKEEAELLAGVRGTVEKKHLELADLDPPQDKLNLQYALNRLVQDAGERTMARTRGVAFQTKYNLTNDQMLTLCKIAIEIGEFQNRAELAELLKRADGLSDVLKAISPDSAKRLGLSESDGAIVGSCSCCCK